MWLEHGADICVQSLTQKRTWSFFSLGIFGSFSLELRARRYKSLNFLWWKVCVFYEVGIICCNINMQNLFNVNTLIVHMLMYACVSIWNFVLFFWYLTYILVVDFFDNAENFVICTIVDYRFHAAILSFFFFLFVERISCWNLTLTIVLSKISKGFCPKILFLNLIISLDFIDLY